MQKEKSFDINSIIEELDAEFASETENQLEDPVDDGEEIEFDSEEEYEDEEESEEEPQEENIEYDKKLDEEKPDEENDDLLSDDVHKRNEAFRRLREERDQLAQSDKFLADMAKQYGLTKDQLIERFENDQIKKEAEEQGIPETQIRRIQEMEKKLKEAEETKDREVFNIKADALASKYKLAEGQMISLFEEAAKMGIDILKNPNLLEVAYKALNYGNAVNEGRQKQLETSKQRRATSTGQTGTKGRQPIETEEAQWDKEIEAYFKDIKI